MGRIRECLVWFWVALPDIQADPTMLVVAETAKGVERYGMMGNFDLYRTAKIRS